MERYSNNRSFVLVKEGQTPFHLAALKNSKECSELLLSHGAEANTQSNVSVYFIYNILDEISYYVVTVITMHRMDGLLFIWLLSVIMKNAWYYCCPMRIRHTLLLYDIMIMLYLMV